AEGAVRADTQHLGIGRLEVADALVEGGHAGASARRPVERVEQQHHFLPVEVLEADLLEPDGLQREVGRRVADIEGLALGGGTHLSCPPFKILRVAGVMIARRSPTFAGALRAAAHACGRRLSSGASARPRYPAAVTTAPVSQTRRKRSVKRVSRSAWWSMITRQPVTPTILSRLSMPRSITAVPTSRSMYEGGPDRRSEEHTSELQSLAYLVCRLLLEKKNRQ